jgi:SAM-dependent methyltransferase
VPERAEADFDQYGERYREAVEDSIAFCPAGLDFFTRVKAETLLQLSERVGPPKGLAFVDIGCGTGETDQFLEGRVRSLAGADVAARLLEQARRLNPWAEYRSYAEGEALPFADGSFDVCFAICVFHHVPRDLRPALVEEMARICRPGGLIAIFEHNPLNPLTRRAVRGCEFDRDAELLTRRESSRLLSEAGLPAPAGRYIEFFPSERPLLQRIERRLAWVPLGAQYAVFARRP